MIEDVKCPVCGKQLKRVLQHIRTAKACNARLSSDQLKLIERKYERIRKEKHKNSQNKRKQKCRKRLIDEDEDKVREQQRKHKEASRKN